MFNLIMLALPGFFKGKLPAIFKYSKWVGVVALLAGLIFALGNWVSNDISKAKRLREQDIAQKAALIATQENQIEQQKQALDDIKQTLEQLKKSNEQTMLMVEQLHADQKKIEITVTKKKQVIDKSLKQIDALDIPESEKDQQKSTVLIKGLNGTYCELFPNTCKTEGSIK